MKGAIDLFFIIGAQYVFILSPIIAIWYFCLVKKKQQRGLKLFAVILIPAAFIVRELVQLVYYSPRPFVSEHIVPLISYPAVNGFPSGHTLFCAIFATLLIPFNRKVSSVLWVITIFVGISRVYVGVHHVADIVGSVVIVYLLGWAIWKAIGYFSDSSIL